jgi:hypothetical protein
MAHRGRGAPVHFRRDFNWHGDISSTSVLLKAYEIELHSGTSPPYLVDGHTFRAQEIAGPDAATLAWLSPLQHIGIHDWQVRLWVRIIQTVDVILQSTWFLEREGILAASWRRNAGDRFDPVGAGNQLTWQTVFNNFDIFPRGAQFNFSFLSPVGYPP